jgi:hypothetical protein
MEQVDASYTLIFQPGTPLFGLAGMAKSKAMAKALGFRKGNRFGS